MKQKKKINVNNQNAKKLTQKLNTFMQWLWK